MALPALPYSGQRLSHVAALQLLVKILGEEISSSASLSASPSASPRGPVSDMGEERRENPATERRGYTKEKRKTRKKGRGP